VLSIAIGGLVAILLGVSPGAAAPTMSQPAPPAPVAIRVARIPAGIATPSGTASSPAPSAHRFATPPSGTASSPSSTIDRARLRAAMAARRATNLDRFLAYRDRRSYPRNNVRAGFLNVWRDEDGHLCAAATIINASDPSLVARVARERNNIKLADVTGGPLLDWILTSGFTHAEIVAIQEPFFGPVEQPVVEDPRVTEDNRLYRRYSEVAAMIAAQDEASLDEIVDALMARPALAAEVL
jgi:hypothetical protein